MRSSDGNLGRRIILLLGRLGCLTGTSRKRGRRQRRKKSWAVWFRARSRSWLELFCTTRRPPISAADGAFLALWHSCARRSETFPRRRPWATKPGRSGSLAGIGGQNVCTAEHDTEVSECAFKLSAIQRPLHQFPPIWRAGVAWFGWRAWIGSAWASHSLFEIQRRALCESGAHYTL